ncbi:carboxypeptidase-like regulatory domain-containing protein [Allotamlana fucoidanivorans]|uniref:carboxypeptidase-like regulatory domain-containing protein n=1 Tax=Allotamlana fucoidanivorans TaxID=2583814 RepID=UPI0013051E0F|nr:carboxypeptidase-like regulatory domain-containing protein [Tamlana fucoidanivorans]
MKYSLFILLFSFFSVVFGQTTEYSGVVKIKGDKHPLPGVSVMIKGTKIGTQTDFDGYFKINVPDSLNTLSFLYVGIKPLDYKLNEKKFLEIFLKEDCTVCFLDHQQIAIYAQSGVIGNPLGGQLDFSFPAFFRDLTLKTGFGYQTNFNENRFLSAFINLEHLFVDCGFSIDINSSVRNFNYDNNIDSNVLSLESSINLRGIQIITGFSNVDFFELDKNKVIKSNGVLVGIGTWIGPPFYASVKAKTSIFKNLSEYQVEIKRTYKQLSSFIRYNKIGGFNELSLGIGYEFTYYLKKREK